MMINKFDGTLWSKNTRKTASFKNVLITVNNKPTWYWNFNGGYKREDFQLFIYIEQLKKILKK